MSAARAALSAALLLVAMAGTRSFAAERAAEPNTQVPAGSSHYVADGFPDRIVATPAQDAATGFAVAWRTDASVDQPWLELVVAGDSPDVGTPRRIRASTATLASENGSSHHHRADIDGLKPDTLYAYRVQGNRTWGAWNHFRTAASPDTPLTLLYFGDTQNKNLSLVSRVIRQAWRSAPDARLALFAGDLVSGKDGQDDNEWAEWFEAGRWLLEGTAVAPAPGNHEYHEEGEDTPQATRTLGNHWPVTFALPRNGPSATARTSYWFDYQGVRIAVLDGTSVLDLGTGPAQAQWLDKVLADNPHPWSIVLIHQPFFSPRADRENQKLVEQVLPVIRRHKVDLVLQGHDHTYGRRGDEAGQATPVFVVSVAGPKQYRLSDMARKTMRPVGEDTQLYQVLRIDNQKLRYESRTATGRLYDAFELERGSDGGKRLVEQEAGRIAPRDCPRSATPKGRADRCWE
ncbi:purple acid phosphatase family protein [Xanthomonas arboricola]|uniref:3',5'-cyclic adenosine monophosphate phosphodiesterase CpdA n=3 Tax=Xanthomonas arboricola TaxID=56448 RepID=A0A8D6V8H9_9XANT|nr:metallophosphoesterase family protein [Xanthomonas arboricola]AKU48781.1 phosphoesterase [Xanthomonas arboricola pv. juglandis]KOA99108.1 phosphoesterase [Xanthomonas arboricola]KOB04582.1 phosphoesterase [Xanthomonas arboricola]KOB06120.1 phosphoesterase [Xanthomonas arboricola]KOB14818.1 phosphoesterase [Xanthomonas arboricola]